MAGDQEDIIQMENPNWRKPAGDLILNDLRKENEKDLRIEWSILIQFIANKIQQNPRNSAGDFRGQGWKRTRSWNFPLWNLEDHQPNLILPVEDISPI